MSLLPSSSLLIRFKDYEQYHLTHGNKLCHLLGVPLVLFSALGLLSKVPLLFGSVDVALALVVFAALFAIRVDLKLSIPFILYIYFNYLIARHLSLPVLVGLQVIAWGFQLWGHYRYEKKSPAFFRNLSHLFVGPLWIFAWLIGYYRPTPS